MVEYNDNFMEEFTKIWERHNVRKETAQPVGKWETIDRYVANDNSRVYMRTNKTLGMYMVELIMGNVVESDVRDDEHDAIDLFNSYVAKAFSHSMENTKRKKERRYA